MDTDRNLLFAVLALQAGLIDREGFVQGCTLWAARKDRPIADLLVEQGWLNAADRDDVERRLERQLHQHGSNARASLAAAADAAIRSVLSTVDDAEVQESLAVLTGPYQPSPADNGELAVPASAGRNLLYEEIGRGGMGRVLRGRDPDLGRDLAVKILREEHGSDTGLERRFVEEAQIGGQLQHPGVVPVYELGRFPDRRPFFTMKLVKGRTLADWLKERPDPAHDQARFLTIFAQVCQTLAYAHSKGVIHRDLKPQNVMVGAFGEVQVMDWGLAKVLGARGGADPEATTAGSLIRTARSGSAAEDGRTGVVGTPAFMPPEQARGAVEDVDERADVFGLGAILCVILTGRPPYTAADREAVMRQAAAGDMAEAFARLDGCGADAELVSLCKECLAPERERRPREASEVAARMAAYQAAVQERLRQAELERTAAEARADAARAKAVVERRARRLTVGLATAVLLLVVVGGGSAWWVQQRQQETDAGVTSLLREARQLFAQAGSSTWADAPRLQEQARDTARKADELAQSGGASGAVKEEAAVLARSLDEEAKAAERDRRLLVALLEVRGPREGPKFQTDEKGVMSLLAEPSAEEQFQAAFQEWDATFNVDSVPTEELAARLKSRPSAVVTEVVAALDEWASERRRSKMPSAKWQPLADLAAALDEESGPRRRELRDLLARGRLGQERALGALAMALRPVPVPFDAGPGEGRNHLRRLAEQTDPVTEPVLGLLTLARALLVAGDEDRAERLLRAALRARPQQVVLHDALGKLLTEQRPPRWSAAVECFAAVRALRPELGEELAFALVMSGRGNEGLALYDRLLTDRKDNPWLHFRRGIALNDQGRHKEAEVAYREAIRLQPDFPEAHNNLGNALWSQGRHKEAEAEYRETLRLKHDDPVAHSNLGVALNAQGRHKEAEAEYREALRLKPDSAGAHSNLGGDLGNQGRYKEAEAEFREAIRLKHDIPEAHHNLGVALSAQGRHKEAEAACREALRLKHDDPEAHTSLGVALRSQGRHKEAEAEYREAIRLKPNAPVPHSNLGNVLGDQRRYKEAEAEYREAIRLKPDYAEAHTNLGAALNDQGRHKEAEAEHREAIRLQPDYPPAHYNLGIALGSQGRYKEAEAAYREAIRLQPDLALAHTNLGSALGSEGRYKEAEAAYREAIRLQPYDPPLHYGLGIALSYQGRYKEAEAEYREAIRLKPDYPVAHVNLGAVLCDHLGRPKEAEAAFREAIRLQPDYPEAHSNLGSALGSQGRYKEAEAAFREALRLQPDEPAAHGNLCWLLERQGRLEESVSEGHAAIRLKPDVGWYHNNLGWSLQRLGRLEDAAAEYRLALRHDPSHEKARVNLRALEPLLALLPRLEAVRRGAAQPVGADEGVKLAQLAGLKRLNCATACLFAEAFAADPKLADDLKSGQRYNAACYAALAAAGQGEDAKNLPDKVQLMLRRQALRWLRADLALYAKLAERDEAAAKQFVRQQLTHWQQDSDLASVRDREALDKLPDDERQEWRQLWADVAALLKKVEEKK